MAKIFDRQLEDLRIKRMNEDRWFMLHQQPLLWLANTREGRDFLCIDQNFPVIHEIAKNYISHHDLVKVEPSRKYPRGWKRVTTTEFRVGSKYANVIRFRWDAWLDYLADYQVGLFLRTIPAMYVPEYAMVRGQQASVMHSTLTVYPDPDPETTTVDGLVGRAVGAGSGAAWTTFITQAGTFAQSNTTDTNFLSIGEDNVSNQWGTLHRSLFLFDTSSLTAGATISAATMSLYGTTKQDDATAITPDINIYSSNPGSNTNLVASDHGTLGSTAFSTAITYGSFSTAGYNDFALNASGLSNISKTGVSKFGAKNANYDAAASAPTWTSLKQHLLRGYYADQGGTTNDPKLVVTYASAVFSKNLFLNQAPKRASFF